MGRSGQDRHSEGDQKNPPYPRGRPVADIIDTVGEILLFYVGFGQKAGVVVVHSDDFKRRNRVYLGGVKIISRGFHMDAVCRAVTV